MFIGQWITWKRRASFSSQKLTSGQKPKWTPNQHLLKAMNRRTEGDYYVSLTHSDDEEDFSKGTAVEKEIKWSAREEPKDFQNGAENWT